MVSTHSDDSLLVLRACGRSIYIYISLYICILVCTQRTSSAPKGVPDGIIWKAQDTFS